MNKCESSCCGCGDLILQLLESHKQQSQLLTAQNVVMAQVMDQNNELMNHLISESEDEADQPDPARSLD